MHICMYLNKTRRNTLKQTIALLSLFACLSLTSCASTATATQAPTIPTIAPTKVPVLVSTPTPKPMPKPVPTQATKGVQSQPVVQQPQPTQPPAAAPATGVNGNPWGYDFTPGSLIYSPNSGFCTYFSCVTTFWKSTNGYVAECGNGDYTHSGGVSGACSKDGGVSRTLYQHP